jgi:hypothetical protein
MTRQVIAAAQNGRCWVSARHLAFLATLTHWEGPSVSGGQEDLIYTKDPHQLLLAIELHSELVTQPM